MKKRELLERIEKLEREVEELRQMIPASQQPIFMPAAPPPGDPLWDPLNPYRITCTGGSAVATWIDSTAGMSVAMTPTLSTMLRN